MVGELAAPPLLVLVQPAMQPTRISHCLVVDPLECRCPHAERADGSIDVDVAKVDQGFALELVECLQRLGDR